MLITELVVAQKAKLQSVEWTLAAELKDSDGNRSLGFAGAINAIDNDVFIVAGGANFPDKMPWDGGKKHYANEIHVLQKTTEGYAWNKAVKAKLPEPIGYCGYTSTAQGIVYAGGENNNGFSNRAYLLNWDDASESVIIKQLANLPVAITNIALTNIGHIVYAVGGDLQNKSSNAFLSLDLSKENAKWENMPNLPVALANTLVVVQQYNHGKSIYMIGGRAKTSSGISNLYHSTFVFDFEKQKWRDAAPISDGKNVTNFSAGSGVAIGDHFILITGGDDGKTFNKIENYLTQIAKSSNDELKRKLTKEKNELNINHKGFYRGMLLYNTLTNTWTKIGDLPFLAQVTTKATLWDGKIVLSNGEVKPGIRTPNVMLGTIKQ